MSDFFQQVYWPLVADYFLLTFGVLFCLGVRSVAIFHPLPIYLFFHAVVVSGRMTAIHFGQVELFTLSQTDYEKALLVADLCLFGMILGSILMALLFRQERGSRGWQAGVPKGAKLPLGSFQLCVVVFAPVGLYSVLVHIISFGDNSGARTATFNLVNAALLWPALLLVIYMAYRGIGVFTLSSLGALAVVYSLQGDQRFRVVVIVLLLVMVLALRAGRTGLRKSEMVVVAVVGLLYFPLDAIGAMFQRGSASAGALLSSIVQSNADALRYRSYDQMIFDHLAAAVYRVDQMGIRLDGLPYLLIATLPIPRALWPDKPTTAVGIEVISNLAFPLDEIGAVLTLPGDLYLNFGLWFVPVGGFLIGLVFAASFYVSGRSSIPVKLLYLGFAAVLIQVYRDGLVSIVVFLVVHLMPLTVFCILASVNSSRYDELDKAGASGE